MSDLCDDLDEPEAEARASEQGQYLTTLSSRLAEKKSPKKKSPGSEEVEKLASKLKISVRNLVSPKRSPILYDKS